MDSLEFGKNIIEDARAMAASNGEGTVASFVSIMANYLVDMEQIHDFVPSYYKGKFGRYNFRVDGFYYDEFDKTMNLFIADFTGDNEERKITKTISNKFFGQLVYFLRAVYQSDLAEEVEPSMPISDLIDLLIREKQNIRKYKLIIFSDATVSDSLKNVSISDFNGVLVEGQIWDIYRLFRVVGSESGMEPVAINFKDYDGKGLPCVDISLGNNIQYKSYLGVIPGAVLADIYDTYDSRLLEGNVRSFLSTKVAVNKQIRNTILNEPEMFFAYNNGISVTAQNVKVEKRDDGTYLTYAENFQIINGGQTTASISNAKRKDKADLSEIFVQMKVVAIDDKPQEEADELIKNISKSSNSQNKVSEVDFFSSHPFHRAMEKIANTIYAPAKGGEQYETRWFYERARGQYVQKQMRLTRGERKRFELIHPKNQVIKKPDLAKVQNTWLMLPHVVSKGAQTNFVQFAKYITEQWDKDKTQYNERYYQKTAALMLLFQALEKNISKQPWYEGGYRANIICYTLSLFHQLVLSQFPKYDLDLMLIWKAQGVPRYLLNVLLELAEKVLRCLTSDSRKVANVTQWCKREDCWRDVQKISYILPHELQEHLIAEGVEFEAGRQAKKVQKENDDKDIVLTILSDYPFEIWKRLHSYALLHRLTTPTDVVALRVAQQMPHKLPNAFQCERLLKLLEKAKMNGFILNP